MKKNEIPHNELRLSQLLTTFGPGAMVDFPDQSVIISGLTCWTINKDSYIREERLQRKVEEILGVKQISFYSPPKKSNHPSAPSFHVKAFVFPQWFLGNVNETHKQGTKEYRTRPLLHRNALSKNGTTNFDGKKISTVPVRFVQACSNGHLSDIDWNAFAHNDFQSTCRGQLWLDEAGSGNDFDDIFVRCECGQRRPLSATKGKNSNILGICKGERPWLGPEQQRERCYQYSYENGEKVCTDKPNYNRLLIRSASNAYFPEIISAISLPEIDSQLRKVLDQFYKGDLDEIEDIEELISTIKRSRYQELRNYPSEQIWSEIQRRKKGHKSDKSIKEAELEVILKCQERSISEQEFDAEELTLNPNSPFSAFLDKTVLVHRLREVITLIGFTRFEANTKNTEGEYDELSINVQRAQLDFTDVDNPWLPAIENKGEGFFISFNKEKIEHWLKQPAVQQRGEQLLKSFHLWLEKRNIPKEKKNFPGLPFLMLHSLSHLLITAVSLDCGYASSAIKERIYACETGYGILLYTGTSGSEGTLGGLVDIGRKIDYYLGQALLQGQLCSNDPICCSHDPTDPYEERFLHGAACHGCLLIAETSCEFFNEYLDRTLVVPTVENLGAEFFAQSLLTSII